MKYKKMKFVFDWKKIKAYLKKNYIDLFFSFLGLATFLFFAVTGAKVLKGDIEPPLDFAQLEGLVLIMFGFTIYNFWNRFKNALKKEKKRVSIKDEVEEFCKKQGTFWLSDIVINIDQPVTSVIEAVNELKKEKKIRYVEGEKN